MDRLQAPKTENIVRVFARVLVEDIPDDRVAELRRALQAAAAPFGVVDVELTIGSPLPTGRGR